jgi:hypothetical protein
MRSEPALITKRSLLVQLTWMFKSSKYYRPYSKSSLTLNEWRFNLSFSWAPTLFLNSWSASVIPYYVTAHPPAIQKQHWHSREAWIEPPLIECEWAFRKWAYIVIKQWNFPLLHSRMWANIQGVPKKTNTIEINVLLEFECLSTLLNPHMHQSLT